MVTSLDISTITYNTQPFLIEKLSELIKSRKISYYCFIHHLPEKEERSEHKHLVISPGTRLDEFDLTDFLTEPVPDNLPLKPIKWNKTLSMSDWFLYAVHDSSYMRLKYGEDKKFHYRPIDLISSNNDLTERYLYQAYHECDFWKNKKYIELLENGESPRDIIVGGYVPMKEQVAFNYLIKNLGSL